MTISTFSEHILTAAKQTGVLPLKMALQCSDFGISGFDFIRSHALDRSDFETIKPLLEAGMCISSMAGHIDLGHSSQSINTFLDDAEKLGTNRIMAIPFSFKPDEDRNRVREKIAENLRKLVFEASKRNITVGMEDFDALESPTARTDDLLWFMENVPGLTCTLDTGNFYYSGEGLLKSLDVLMPFVKSHVHCKDRACRGRKGERTGYNTSGVPMYPCAVGYGVLPLRLALHRMCSSGFDGCYTIEHFGSSDMAGDLERSARTIMESVRK